MLPGTFGYLRGTPEGFKSGISVRSDIILPNASKKCILSVRDLPTIKPTRNPLKRQEQRNDLTQLLHPNMSTEREIVEKFKEAVEARNVDIIAPYVAEDATVDLLPSTFVVSPSGGTAWVVLSVMMQGWDEADRGSVDQQDGRKARCPAVHQGQDLTVDLTLLSADSDSSSLISPMSLSIPCSSLSRQVNLTLEGFTCGLTHTTVVGKHRLQLPIRPTRCRNDVPLPLY